MHKVHYQWQPTWRSIILNDRVFDFWSFFQKRKSMTWQKMNSRKLQLKVAKSCVRQIRVTKFSIFFVTLCHSGEWPLTVSIRQMCSISGSVLPTPVGGEIIIRFHLTKEWHIVNLYLIGVVVGFLMWPLWNFKSKVLYILLFFMSYFRDLNFKHWNWFWFFFCESLKVW